ncbi:MAG: hypothetical protein IJ283_01450 [Oscillospiraceae bacterium]|nr:hypothetical protein [Oscillospiraceae bacterium]
MVNIWDYADYSGRVKIVTTDEKEIVGKVYYVEDKDEADIQDDCLNIIVDGIILGIYQKDILKIEKLG